MKVSYAVMLLLNFEASRAQQVTDVVEGAQQVLGGTFTNAVNTVVQPITDAMEPYKVHNGTTERGVPHVHEDLGKFQNLP